MGEAVAGGAGFDDGSAVGEAVDDRGAQAGVGEGLGPAAERFVGGDRDGGLLFAFGEDLEQQFGAAPVELSPRAIYTLAFLVFWMVIATAGALTQLLVEIVTVLLLLLADGSLRILTLAAQDPDQDAAAAAAAPSLQELTLASSTPPPSPPVRCSTPHISPLRCAAAPTRTPSTAVSRSAPGSTTATFLRRSV